MSRFVSIEKMRLFDYFVGVYNLLLLVFGNSFIVIYK